jgi:hypothetical protein
MVIALLAWPAGLLHAFWVNMTVRLWLRDQKDSDHWEDAAPVTGTPPFARSHQV